MSRLNSRLAKLERRLGVSGGIGSLIILRELVWREKDELRSAPAYASILTGTVCERVEYSKGETEAAFEARVDAKACSDVERLAEDAGSGIGRKRVQVDAEAAQVAAALDRARKLLASC
jgi:hypothetical protein